MIKVDRHLTLVPQSFSYGVIEYKVPSKGFTEPFVKVQAVFTFELKDK